MPSSTQQPAYLPPLVVGQRIADSYRIDRVLWTDDSSQVVLATHTDLKRSATIKVFLTGSLSGQEDAERFMREVRIAGKLRSEHVARVLDSGQLTDGCRFLATEYVSGQSLAEAYEQHGALSLVTAVDYVLQAAKAVAEAHAAGIVHRNLNPENLFLCSRADGSALIKVLHFNLAKRQDANDITNTGALLGSPVYSPPEQLRSAKAADGRADIWALAATLFELVTAVPLFTGKTVPAVCANIVANTPPDLSPLRDKVPAGFISALEVALRKDPSQRYPDLGALAEAISPFGTPVQQFLQQFPRLSPA